jgi:hypothetical protein
MLTEKLTGKCKSKVRYFSPREASDAAIDYCERHPKSEGNIKAYKCPYCPYWHIGHSDKEKLSAPTSPVKGEFEQVMDRLGVKRRTI